MTEQQPGASMLRCVLVADDGSETVLSVPSLAVEPPGQIRVPSSIGGAAVMDVYRLSHEREAPREAVFIYVGTVPRSTDEVPDAEPGEQGPRLPE